MSDFVERCPSVVSALDYAESVVAGAIDACKWTRLACQRQLDDLQRSASDTAWPYQFDPDKAERACKFIQKLPHTKGRWAANKLKIKLEPWQCFKWTTIFGWVDRLSEKRRYREAYIEVPRKNAKSIGAASVGLYCLVADDEYGAEVYSGATSEHQAWEVFRPAKLMAQRTPDLLSRYGVEVNASSLSVPADGSRFAPIIGKPGDGASPHCAIIDEYHEHAGPDLYDTMVTGMGARDQPLTLIITTAGSNIHGPCYEKRDYVRKVLDGANKDDRVFGIIYSIDDDEIDDWGTEAALRKANPNYDVSVSGDYLLGRLSEALQSSSRQQTFKTKHLNIWGGAKGAWMNLAKWNACPDRKPLSELEGRRCFMALDLASKVDIAALVLLFPPTDQDPLYHVHGRYYLPETVVEDKSSPNHSRYEKWSTDGLLTLTDGASIDYEAIMDDMKEFSGRFEVVEAPFDPWQAAHLAGIMLDEGAPMVEIRATVQNFSEPMKEVEAKVLDGTLAHGGCPVMRWMISNVVAKMDKKDNIYPNKEFPENKIDGPVALIMAMARSMVHREKTSVYEERGLL